MPGPKWRQWRSIQAAVDSCADFHSVPWQRHPALVKVAKRQTTNTGPKQISMDRRSSALILLVGRFASLVNLAGRKIERDFASIGPHKVKAEFSDVRVWILSAIYLGIVMGSYGIGFWLPSLISALGVKDSLMVGPWSVIPNAGGILGMYLFAKSSDRRLERFGHVAFAAVLGAIGLTASAMLGSSIPMAISFLTLATFGIYAALPVFWAIPPIFLAGAASAAGIALINSIGNVAGFVSPFVIGWVKQTTGSSNVGLYVVSVCLICAAAALISIRARFGNKA